MQGLRILGESVSMQTIPFDTLAFDDLCKPFGSQRNDYSYFQSLISRFGVYIVQEKETGKVLYVGEAHAQDLKERITQNYTERDTGGTFRDNWCANESQDFAEFKAALNNWTIKIVSIDTESKDLIRAIEAVLISALKPQHNK